jgi:hypothetical protein
LKIISAAAPALRNSRFDHNLIGQHHICRIGISRHPLGGAVNRNNIKEVAMRKIISYLAFLLMFLFACCSEPVEPITGEATIEGTIEYYQAPPAIGGECDPDGYIIINPKWISGEPSYSYGRVYLKDGQITNHVSQKVRIGGTLDSLFAGGVETPRRKFPLINVSGIQIIK